jgi:hypothetical protein
MDYPLLNFEIFIVDSSNEQREVESCWIVFDKYSIQNKSMNNLSVELVLYEFSIWLTKSNLMWLIPIQHYKFFSVSQFILMKSTFMMEIEKFILLK